MTRRRSLPMTFVALAALAALAVAPPAAASGGHGKPSPPAMLHKGLVSSARAAAAEDEGNEAETVRQRAEFEQSITSAPAEVAPAAGLVAATSAAAALPATGGRWTEVTGKPFLNDPIQRGANFGVGQGYVSGRMTAFATAGRYVYAGSASGGVWRTSTLGASWRTVNRGLPRLAVGALASSPRDGSVWVGTGEANNSSDSQYGVGVYRLARGATTWTRVGGRELFGAGIHRIMWVHGHVYAATTHGLYRRSATAHSGAAWTAVLQPAGDVAYPPSSDVTDVMAVPGSGGRRILAVVGWTLPSDPPAQEHNGFYVGTGGRGSFTRISVTGDINPATIGRTTFSSSHGWLYAVVSDTATNSLRGQGVYLSASGRPAGPWKRVADPDKLAASDSAMGDSHTTFYPGVQSWYNQNIVADPKNRRHVYLQLEEVYESTDGGATWATVGPYWNFDISCEEANGNPYDCPFTTHPDQHAGLIAAGRFWAGSDGGVWRRPLSWHRRGHWTDLNPTLHTLQEYSVDVGPVGQDVAYWSGTQDNGEPYTRTDLSRVEQAFTGDGGDTIVDPRDGNKAVEEYIYLDMYLTTDAGVSLREISPSCLSAGNPPAPCDPSPRFIAPIEKDVADPDHWVAGGRYVWDDTRSWDTVCASSSCDWKPVYDTGAGHSVTALAANRGVTYAAWCGPCNPGATSPFSRGLATDYGGTWHALSISQLPDRYITSLAVDPDDAAHVYAGVGSYSRRWIPDAGVGHVFESTDGGASWADISVSLPDAPVYKVALSAGRVVVGTEVGVFAAARPVGTRTTALSRTSTAPRTPWRRLGAGLPAVTVWDLAITADGRVVAGTHGRGTWELAPAPS